MQPGQLRARFYRYRLPFVRPVQFGPHRLPEREGLLLALEGTHGTGWGEIAPLPGFSRETLAEAQDALQGVLSGTLEPEKAPASVRFGLDCARRPYPLEVAEPPIYPLLQGEPGELLNRLEQLRQQGHRRFKLKVARLPHSEELQLLADVARQAPDCQFSLDANGGLQPSEALALADQFKPGQLRYFEEPCAQLEQIQQLAEQGVSVALDEHLDQFSQPFPGLAALVVKPSLVGSIASLEQWIRLARAQGYQAILSSSFESQLGLRHLAQLSLEILPGQEAGLGTANYFQHSLLDAHGYPDLSQLECLWTC